MSAPAFILRIVMFPVMLLAVGAIAVFGYVGMIEPISNGLPGPPTSLGWSDPGGTTMLFASVALVALLLVIVIWFISAPIRADQRQEVRR